MGAGPVAGNAKGWDGGGGWEGVKHPFWKHTQSFWGWGTRRVPFRKFQTKIKEHQGASKGT